MPDYFRGPKGKKDIDAVADGHQCIAIVDPDEWQSRRPKVSCKRGVNDSMVMTPFR